MYPFGRLVIEEELPLAARYLPFYEPMFSSWTMRVKIAFVVTIAVILAIFMGVFIYLEYKHPMQSMMMSTVTPPEHFMFTLAPYKERHRQTYAKNVFIEMLHQTHSTTNMTKCWVCGLLPSVMHKHDLFLSLPLSFLGSCEVWFQMLSAMYNHYVAHPKQYSERDYEMILAYIEMHQGFDPEVNNGEGSLDPSACMNVYTDNINDTWLIDELFDFASFNDSQYFQQFISRNVTSERIMPIPILNTSSPFCIKGAGHVQVGISLCNYTYNLKIFSSPPLLTPPNVYFVCGENAYTWLPRGWAGQCYLSFLYPPVYIAPPDYHKTHQLYNSELAPHRQRRQLTMTEVDQTDTSLQQFTDFTKGLVPFWGPIFNSREIRRLSRVVENVINITTDIMANITEELQATRLVSLQNRMVLDVLLADRGGACRVIGSSCCVYIPDSAPTVHLAIQKLHRIAAEMHVENGSWSLSGWFWGFLSTWGWKVLLILGGAAGILFVCCLCLQCGPACCSYCASRLTAAVAPSTTPTKAQMLQQEIRELMRMDEDLFDD
ncbi:uncharacterized protein LOC144821918 [Lissotriton helveticus]